MKGPRYIALAVAVTTMIAAASAAAQIELRFVPADQRIAVGGGGGLSVMLEDALDVRTIELWVSYDETVLTSTSGEAGQLFEDSGCQLFRAFDEDVPGAWYAGAVTMGPGCFVTGPGELYRWNFEGLADGTCHVRVDSVVLYDQQAMVIDDVSLSVAKVFVGDLAAVDAPPAEQLALSVYPNPFNASTTVRFGGLPEERVRVEIYDLAGWRLTTLWSGRLGRGPGAVQWDGTDRRGRTVPGGVYLFRISGRGDRSTTRKGILLK